MKLFSIFCLGLVSSDASSIGEEGCQTKPVLGLPGTFPATSLSSYPGSGNTWIRFLIEQLTGYYTGSIYSDNKLYEGGFRGEKENWKEGTVIAVKAHSFRKDRPIGDAILVIRNPYDAILAEFNRHKGGGDHHTGVAAREDFESPDWTELNLEKRAFRWYKLYAGNLESGKRTLPIFYEDMKTSPLEEMKKIVKFLDISEVGVQDKLDCINGKHSERFRRSKGNEVFSPWDLVKSENYEIINYYIKKLNQKLIETHGINIPETYIRH